MLLQGRIMAEYAAYRAVRAGSVNQGSCQAMLHAGLAAFLPTVTKTDSPADLAGAFNLRRDNRYQDGVPQHVGPIVEIVRESPVGPFNEEESNDQPDVENILEARMVFWLRMKIPFANWVMARIFLAQFGQLPYTAQNPLMETERANWTLGSATFGPEGWPGGDLGGRMNTWAGDEKYLFPIKVNYSMRMMTPPRGRYFSGGQDCPITPPNEIP